MTARRCEEPGCQAPHYARGRCERHYRRLRRAEQAGTVPPVEVPAAVGYAELAAAVRATVERLPASSRVSWRAQLALGLAEELEAGGPLLPIARELRAVMGGLDGAAEDDDALAQARAARADRQAARPVANPNFTDGGGSGSGGDPPPPPHGKPEREPRAESVDETVSRPPRGGGG